MPDKASEFFPEIGNGLGSAKQWGSFWLALFLLPITFILNTPLQIEPRAWFNDLGTARTLDTIKAVAMLYSIPCSSGGISTLDLFGQNTRNSASMWSWFGGSGQKSVCTNLETGFM
jgi:hypothetical protein